MTREVSAVWWLLDTHLLAQPGRDQLADLRGVALVEVAALGDHGKR
ncbi:MAG TPA: hypothetical protein VFU65_03340 [Actinocrinis sp.]|nr:hypothetical protein [Actinocrinis sp.]